MLIEYEALNSTDFFNTARYSKVTSVTLDTNTSLLGDDLYVKINSEYTYILDKQQSSVFIYDNFNGTMISSICNIGRGPGEYLFIRDFYIEQNNDILLLCDAKPKMIRYKQTGQFISMTPLSFNGLSFTKQNDSYWFFKERLFHPSFNNNTIVKTDNMFKPIGSYFAMQESMVAGFSEMNFSMLDDGDILFKHVFDNTIYEIVQDKDSIVPVYVIDWGSYKYPESFLNSKSFTEAFNVLSSTTTASIVSAFENSDYLLLYITEEGVNNNFVYLLYNRKTGEILFQKFKADHLIINKLGPPKALTSDNAIVFIVNSHFLKDIETIIPILSQLSSKQDILIKDNYMLLNLYIK